MDGCAGAVMQKPLTIKKCYGRVDGLTDRPQGKFWSRVSVGKNAQIWTQVS